MFKNFWPYISATNLWKIFEKLIFNEVFKFFIENEFISLNESGYKSGDLRINQLLAINHEIYKSFKVRGVFLDILKAFDMRVSFLN